MLKRIKDGMEYRRMIGEPAVPRGLMLLLCFVVFAVLPGVVFLSLVGAI